MIQPLREVGFSEDSLNTLFQKVKDKSGMLKNINNLNAFLQFFSIVTANGPYSADEAKEVVEIIEEILEGKKEVEKELKGQKKRPKRKEKGKGRPEKEVMRDLLTYTNILQLFGKEEFLSGKGKDPQTIFQNKFTELFDVSGRVPDVAKAYQVTIAQFRNPTALFTYRRTINKLPEGEGREVHNALNDYVAAVLTGTFPKVRYSKEAVGKSEHLKIVFSHGETEIKWCKKADSKFVFLADEKKKVSLRAKEFLKHEVIEDNHIDPNTVPRLAAFLRNQQVSKPRDLESSTALFENLAMDFCKGTLTAQEFSDEVNKLENFPLPQAFSDNLKDLLAMRTAAGKYQIEESDDACDLLLIGTEIQGSCQRVDGDPALNKGLPAYLMNGEVRAIAIKKEDKLVARSIMRLLWDPKKGSPVLLLERPYKNVQHSAINDAIKEWAIEKAKEMGIPLVSKEYGATDPYDGTVELLGGYAPFTYSDAAGGIIPRTRHATIEGCRFLYNPTGQTNKREGGVP